MSHGYCEKPENLRENCTIVHLRTLTEIQWKDSGNECRVFALGSGMHLALMRNHNTCNQGALTHWVGLESVYSRRYGKSHLLWSTSTIIHDLYIDMPMISHTHTSSQTPLPPHTLVLLHPVWIVPHGRWAEEHLSWSKGLGRRMRPPHWWMGNW